MNDPWRQREQDPEANNLLGLYAQRGSETPLSRIVPNREPALSGEEVKNAHAIMLALGWVEPVWSEASARGKPLGYRLVAAGKEWQQKAATRLADQGEEESA